MQYFYFTLFYFILFYFISLVELYSEFVTKSRSYTGTDRVIDGLDRLTYIRRALELVRRTGPNVHSSKEVSARELPWPAACDLYLE